MSPEFLKSDAWVSILDGLINRLGFINPIQAEIDVFYDDMLSQIFIEMDEYIEYYKVYANARKRLKIQKPYWNDDLMDAWKTMVRAEKSLRKNINRSLRSYLRSDFLTKQKQFDKLLRQTERRYNRQKAFDIEQINTKNPTEFWRQINDLGPKKSQKIPMEVYDSTNSNKLFETEEVQLSQFSPRF